MSDRRPPSPRLTEKERKYRAALEEAAERGVSQAQLSVELDVPMGTLSWWKGEIRRREALRRGISVKRRSGRVEESVDFVAVKVAEEVESAAAAPAHDCDRHFEVTLPGGAVVRVPTVFEDATLARVIRAVNAAC